MPSSGTEVHSFNEVWTKKHLSLPVKSLANRPNNPDSDDNTKEDFDDLLHLKCRLINTAGNERSEVDVKLPYERPLISHRNKGSPVYNTIGKKDKPTLDEVLGSIPLVYNPFTKQLELESRQQNKRTGSNGTCFPMDRDGTPSQRDCFTKATVDGHCEDQINARPAKGRFNHREKAEAVGGEVEEEPEKGELSCLDPADENGRSPVPCTDTASFSSMSSVGTEHSFGVGGESNQARSNSSLCYSCDNLQSLPEDPQHKGAKPKKWGLSNLFLK